MREAQALTKSAWRSRASRSPTGSSSRSWTRRGSCCKGTRWRCASSPPGRGAPRGPGDERAPEAFRAAGEAASPPAEGVESVTPSAGHSARIRARASRRPPPCGRRTVGTLYVGTREEREFTESEAVLLAGLAAQAAIAIERARLSEEVRSLAALEERERLAREMHDGLAQALGLLHMKLQGALARSADAPAARRGPARDGAHHRRRLRGGAPVDLRPPHVRLARARARSHPHRVPARVQRAQRDRRRARGPPAARSARSLPPPRSRPSASSRRRSPTCGSTPRPITPGSASSGTGPGSG